MLRHETILGLLDLSQMRGVKPACAKFALKGVPKKKQSWAIMPGDERADSRLPMRAPAFYRESSHSPGKGFLSNRSLTTTNRAGWATDPKAQAQARGAIGSLWVVVVNRGAEQWKKEVRDGRQRQEG